MVELERLLATGGAVVVSDDAELEGIVGAARRAGAEVAVVVLPPHAPAGDLVKAARAAHLAGRDDRALELLDRALPLATEPRARAEVQRLRGRIETWRAPGAAYELLVEEARRVEPHDPNLAAALLADAALAGLAAGGGPETRETFERARRLDLPLVPSLLVSGVRTVEAEGTAPVERRWPELLAAARDPMAAAPLLNGAAAALSTIGEHARAAALAARAVEAARAAGAVGVLPDALITRASFDFWRGRWKAARRDAEESRALAEELGQPLVLVHALFHLALIDAFQGREEPCRAHAARGAELAASLGIAHPTSERVQLALLELGLGRVERAIEELERLPPRQRHARPADLPGAQLLVESYVRAGRLREARETLERFERAVALRPRPPTLALAARCRGLVAPEDEFESHFADALRQHGPHESLRRARTELCLGERRRRAGRRVQARRSLRAALATFERLGARPWTERARRELEAAGDGRPEERVGELTPRELQVARAVALGARNREVGAALYLSPKTVEYHLGKVFRKLGVRSRTELAHLLATELRS